MTTLVLILGLCASSSAAILIRLCDAPPLVIAAYRLGISALILLPLAAVRNRPETVRLVRTRVRVVGASGAFLALHFATWITSLSHTSVASSGLLVTTTPIFVAFGAWLFLGERISRRMAVGTCIALVGSAVVTIGDHAEGQRALYGDMLALAGAIMISGHFLIGRRARASESLIPYLAPVNAVGAGLLFTVAALSGAPLIGFTTRTYALFLSLALVPQLIGHSCLNFALKHVTASTVTLVMLAEPILSATMAYFILGESPPPAIYPGGSVILIGIALAVSHKR